MVPTLRTVLAIPGRPVVLRVGADAVDRPVRWVAVSELEDPTPYLQGGELLLTTGIRLTEDRFDAFVDRLVAADVAALGLGVGLTHPSMPPELVAAAERHGLPLLEVPEPTPFIAISKAVSDVLAAAEYEAVTHAVDAQRDLTRAALAPGGSSAVVSRLARELDARVVLLDPAGRLLHAAPAADDVLVGRLAEEVERLRSRGARTSAAFSDGQWSAVLQPLAPAGRLRGYLAVLRDAPFTTVDHSLVNVGVALVSLALEQPAGAEAARRQLRSAALELLVGGTPGDRLPLAALGWTELGAGEVRVVVADAGADAAEPVLEALDEPGSRWCAAALVHGRLTVLVPDDDAAEAAVVAAGPGLAWGVSPAHPLDELGAGLDQARRALAAARPGGVRRFAELAADGVAGLVDVEVGQGFADALLAPLDARDRGDLVASVRAWLAHHGQWDAAAQELGVHRHTLRYRMRRVEELLGRSLDDPDLRADLWVALTLRERDGSEQS